MTSSLSPTYTSHSPPFFFHGLRDGTLISPLSNSLKPCLLYIFLASRKEKVCACVCVGGGGTGCGGLQKHKWCWCVSAFAWMVCGPVFRHDCVSIYLWHAHTSCSTNSRYQSWRLFINFLLFSPGVLSPTQRRGVQREGHSAEKRPTETLLAYRHYVSGSFAILQWQRLCVED